MDTAARHGLDVVAQVELGSRAHRQQIAGHGCGRDQRRSVSVYFVIVKSIGWPSVEQISQPKLTWVS